MNVSRTCSNDNECALATMSGKSKIQFKGNLALKAKIKHVTTAYGGLITTGAEGAADNLVLKIDLNICPLSVSCGDPTSVYLKVVLTKGNGSLDIDLALVLAVASGTPVNVADVALFAAPYPGYCLGTNTPADIIARLNNGYCSNSILRGGGGLLSD